MDPRLDRLFASLEAQFGAAVARAEEEAAQDLAVSLRQGLSACDVLSTGGWLASMSSGWRAVREVAKDHVRVEPGGEIVPLSAGVFRRGGGAAPRRTDQTLLQVLRDGVRSWPHVVIELDNGTFMGRPLACGETHLLITGRGQESLLPIAQMRSIKPSLEG